MAVKTQAIDFKDALGVKMKRPYILLFCILLVGLIAKPCCSKEGNKIDGYAWKSWTEAWKLGWAEGFSNGIYQAHLDIPVYILGCAKAMLMETTREVERTKELSDDLYKDFTERIGWGKGTYGQMIAGLDEFYKDYRNKKILVREASYIVKLELMGAPQEFIEQVTRILRMPLDHRNKEKESLLKGNREYKKTWEKWEKQIPISLFESMFK